MPKLLLYLLESGAGLLVFYLLYTLLLKRETCFTYNRLYLLVSPLVSVVLPLVELPFFQQPEPLIIFFSEQLAPITIRTNATAAAPESAWFTAEIILLTAYALGFCFFSFRLGRQLYQLRQFTQQTQATSFYWQNILVHQTNGAQPTFSFGNRIFWNNSQLLSATETEKVLLHEAVHIRQKHSLDVLYLEILCVILWFNPFLYLYQQALISTHEFIADAAVLRTTSPDTYARLLAKQVLHRLEFSFGNYFNKSLTLNRMKMIQQTDRRPNKLKQLAALPIFGVLVFMLSCADVESPVISDANPINSSELIPPQFLGGRIALQEYLVKNIQYPADGFGEYNKIIVVHKAAIGKDGRILKQELNSKDDAFTKEIKRLVNNMPSWKPASKSGELIEAYYTLNFLFSRGDAKGDLEEDGPFITTRNVEQLIIPDSDRITFSAGDIVRLNGKNIMVGQLDNTNGKSSIASFTANNPMIHFVMFQGRQAN